MADESPVGATEGGRTNKRADRIYSLLTLILGATLARGGSVVTTVLQLNGANESQQAQFHEEKAREDRAKKAEVYGAFLDAANVYSYTTEDARDCIFRARDSRQPGTTGFTLDGRMYGQRRRPCPGAIEIPSREKSGLLLRQSGRRRPGYRNRIISSAGDWRTSGLRTTGAE